MVAKTMPGSENSIGGKVIRISISKLSLLVA
jgi:hypothetical protein